MFVKPILVLCCLVVAVLSAGMYTDRYDSINLREILDSKRLLLAYVDCMMDRGKCTPDGKELKSNMQDALETGCDKCTETQKNGAQTVVEHLIQHELAIWKELCGKYDPEGVWRKKYEQTAREKGIIIPQE